MKKLLPLEGTKIQEVMGWGSILGSRLRVFDWGLGFRV